MSICVTFNTGRKFRTLFQSAVLMCFFCSSQFSKWARWAKIHFKYPDRIDAAHFPEIVGIKFFYIHKKSELPWNCVVYSVAMFTNISVTDMLNHYEVYAFLLPVCCRQDLPWSTAGPLAAPQHCWHAFPDSSRWWSSIWSRNWRIACSVPHWWVSMQDGIKPFLPPSPAQTTLTLLCRVAPDLADRVCLRLHEHLHQMLPLTSALRIWVCNDPIHTEMCLVQLADLLWASKRRKRKTSNAGQTSLELPCFNVILIWQKWGASTSSRLQQKLTSPVCCKWRTQQCMPKWMFRLMNVNSWLYLRWNLIQQWCTVSCWPLALKPLDLFVVTRSYVNTDLIMMICNSMVSGFTKGNVRPFPWSQCTFLKCLNTENNQCKSHGVFAAQAPVWWSPSGVIPSTRAGCSISSGCCSFWCSDYMKVET